MGDFIGVFASEITPRLLDRRATGNPDVSPSFPGQLDLCVELTKPVYLKIRHLGTPQNHRSPPS